VVYTLEKLCGESLNMLEQILLEVQLHWDFKSKDLDVFKENDRDLRKIAAEKLKTQSEKVIEDANWKLQNNKLTLKPAEIQHLQKVIENAQALKVCFCVQYNCGALRYRDDLRDRK
jgi:hypothetical protein